jgi:transposase-like protein
VKNYPAAYKAKMIRRMSGPRATSATALSRETGVAQATLSRWLKAAATVRPMSRTKSDDEPKVTSKRPEDWTPAEKFEAVLEATNLTEDQLGAFLRRRGLHAEHLAQWRDQATEALSSRSRRKGRTTEQKRIRALERELARKEKALAEAAALLMLKKKLEAYYGEDEDDDTRGKNDA